VVRAHGGLGAPALLEEGFLGSELEREFAGFGPDGAFPEIVQVLR